MHKEKEKNLAEKIGWSSCFWGFGVFRGEVYAKMENGGDWGKMVENWVLFCIKVGGELLGFKHF
ncbi:hypothetical protein CHBNIII7_04760 [Haemophilus influenzae]|uniref:hypothetical protein n=1 Tax=Haemophilus influenzae TaxID=727 RepID=UPI0012902CFD|nr:hypothetical protein [Haemophilus influenzae]BBF06593.1 hypothetical protein CHBNIII7_04760 [Haemophilus influenzae]